MCRFSVPSLHCKAGADSKSSGNESRKTGSYTGWKQQPALHSSADCPSLRWQTGSARQPDADNQRRNSVYLHYFTQADLKQPQDKARLLIERIGQQAVVAVHKKRLCKVRTTVDSVHYKYKVRKPSHHDFVNDGFFFGQQIDSYQHGGDKESAHIGNLLCRVPEYLLCLLINSSFRYSKPLRLLLMEVSADIFFSFACLISFVCAVLSI